MQEYRAAAADDARRGVVIDLDDEIVEVVVALEPVAAVIAIQPYRPVVTAAMGVLAPAVLWLDGASGKKVRGRVCRSARHHNRRGRKVPFGVPPSPSRLLAIISAAPKGDRDRLSASRKPAPAGIARGGADPDRGQRPITSSCLVSN